MTHGQWTEHHLGWSNLAGCLLSFCSSPRSTGFISHDVYHGLERFTEPDDVRSLSFSGRERVFSPPHAASSLISASTAAAATNTPLFARRSTRKRMDPRCSRVATFTRIARLPRMTSSSSRDRSKAVFSSIDHRSGHPNVVELSATSH